MIHIFSTILSLNYVSPLLSLIQKEGSKKVYAEILNMNGTHKT